MNKPILEFLSKEANNLQQAGLLRRELVVDSPPGASVTLEKAELLNLCGTDYLGLSSHLEMKRAAKAAIDTYGAGAGSARPMVGTLRLHVELERTIAKFLDVEDALVFPSVYHANTGLLESLAGDRDYVFCDAQAEPSVADGVRLSRARVFTYRNNDTADLEDRLRRSRAARFRVIVTDGVFPLDGSVSDLAGICALAEKYEAMVVVEDSHGLGVVGPTGRGSVELLGVESSVDAITGSLAHAFGAGAGGFVAGRKEIIAWLRQKSRPHLVSTALSPAACAAAIKGIELASASSEPRHQVRELAGFFRAQLAAQGFYMLGAEFHPTVSALMGDAVATQRMADLLYRKGVLVTGFCHPVVPEGAARLRALVTSRHTQKSLK
ncbi:MAG: aminotransferase class I/II-fold pyridoxal phosphate-dependent enzyme, partial [Myxococcaceae bacterium]